MKKTDAFSKSSKKKKPQRKAKGVDIINRIKCFTSPFAVIGLLFLVNPYISLFDLLPDCIGYALIFVSLVELRHLSERLYLASNRLVWLFCLSVIRIIAFFLTQKSDSSMIMLLTFTFAICETVLLLMFFNDYFEGIEYTVPKYGGSFPKDMKDTRIVTAVFVIAKLWLGFLPELFALIDVEILDAVEDFDYLTEISKYRPLAVAAAAFVIAAIGIWWYVSVFRYNNSVRKCRSFSEGASYAYSDYLESTRDYRRTRSFRIAFVLAVIGLIFLLDIDIEGYPLLPSALSSLLLFASVCFYFRKPVVKLIPLTVITASVQTFSSIVTRIITNIDERQYYRAETLTDLTVTETALLALTVVISSILTYIFVAEILSIFDTEKRFRYKSLLILLFYILASSAGTIFTDIYSWMLPVKLGLTAWLTIHTAKKLDIVFSEKANLYINNSGNRGEKPLSAGGKN